MCLIAGVHTYSHAQTRVCVCERDAISFAALFVFRKRERESLHLALVLKMEKVYRLNTTVTKGVT